MRDLGINLFAFDYRGFGESSGTPDERGLYDDATASYQFLIRSLGVPPERIVLFGHSLGSGVAIELASRVPAAGLIVEGAYTSVVDRGQVLHSPEDMVIPYAHGRRLFDAARSQAVRGRPWGTRRRLSHRQGGLLRCDC